MRWRRLAGGVLPAAVALMTLGCAHAAAHTSAVGASAGHVPASATAGSGGPSVSARMICAGEAPAEVVKALGVGLDGDPAAVWSAPVYTCTYTTSSGVLVLSVRELTSVAQTGAYFRSARSAAASPEDFGEAGDAAFATADGSVFVRKDAKVLYVDMSRMSGFVGQPPLPRATAGIRVAQVIMGCWTGQ
jgi:hypothetical protein